ncbi:hypothetical protein [Streptomyces sp. 2A115]|uniref:hypothetical protein n=1 Tax=Streptomyces sp. 2A115 TaxID=3457439 RepID=UPI003FCF2366
MQQVWSPMKSMTSMKSAKPVTSAVPVKSRRPMSRTTLLAAAAVSAASALFAVGAAPAHAAPDEPLVTTGDVGVRTGDVDLLEDVLEHISVPFGGSGTLTHQLYDSRGADAG